jgi:hypothetical protein
MKDSSPRANSLEVTFSCLAKPGRLRSSLLKETSALKENWRNCALLLYSAQFFSSPDIALLMQ